MADLLVDRSILSLIYTYNAKVTELSVSCTVTDIISHANSRRIITSTILFTRCFSLCLSLSFFSVIKFTSKLTYFIKMLPVLHLSLDKEKLFKF